MSFEYSVIYMVIWLGICIFFFEHRRHEWKTNGLDHCFYQRHMELDLKKKMVFLSLRYQSKGLNLVFSIEKETVVYFRCIEFVVWFPIELIHLNKDTQKSRSRQDDFQETDLC